LLEQRISQLGLSLDGTPLQPLIQQLYDELSQKGLVYHPPCHVGDEWFVPVGIPAIFIPFFLMKDRLRELERKIILEVEGERPEWFMKLIRPMQALSRQVIFETLPDPPRRKRLGNKVLDLN